MLRYAPPAYRPAVSSPTIRRLGQRHYSPSLSQTFDGYFGWTPAMGDAVRLAFHSATAVLGFHVWKNDAGFFKWFGLLLGVGQSVGAVCDLLSLIQRAVGTHPPEGTAPAAKPNA